MIIMQLGDFLRGYEFSNFYVTSVPKIINHWMIINNFSFFLFFVLFNVGKKKKKYLIIKVQSKAPLAEKCNSTS